MLTKHDAELIAYEAVKAHEKRNMAYGLPMFTFLLLVVDGLLRMEWIGR